MKKPKASEIRAVDIAKKNGRGARGELVAVGFGTGEKTVAVEIRAVDIAKKNGRGARGELVAVGFGTGDGLTCRRQAGVSVGQVWSAFGEHC